MGLFDVIGKAFSTVAKVGLGFATGGIGGAAVAGAQSLGLLKAKSPMGTTASKYAVLGRFSNPMILRGATPTFTPTKLNLPGAAGKAIQIYNQTQKVLRASPVLPGGAIATPSGPVAQSGAVPPSVYRRSSSKRSKKRRTKSHSTKRRSTKSRKRKTKLKFGSRAWQAKYNPRYRRARR